MSAVHPWASALVVAALALVSSGCRTEAYCFADCPGTSSIGTGGHGTSSGTTGDTGDCLFGCGTTSTSGSAGGGNVGACVPTNGGVEICDGIDNDCNGVVDDIPGLDPTAPKTCGTCSNDCYEIAGSNWDPLTIACAPPSSAGAPGKCSGSCTTDYFDLNGDGLCEYYCAKTANDDKLCNNKDDDCDGLVDEDVDLCASTTDCGACGHACSLPHATPVCAHTGSGACDTSNTQCQIQACDCTGPNDCWHDLDKSAATGCEYPCYPTGPEICGDGIDNDCNGLIDEADPGVLSDPQLGQSCFGGTKGACIDPSHAGVTACVSHHVTCVGKPCATDADCNGGGCDPTTLRCKDLLRPGERVETCNGVDDDCNGLVDDNPTDVGGACGGAAFAPCRPGVLQCQGGAKVCVGAVDPTPEVCDGIDNDCNGVIDDGLPSAPCNVPTPPPAGATSPCKAGLTACVGGTTVCQGSVGPASTSDTCGVDANCDGVLTSQPDLQTDVHNCGACGNDCYAGAVHAIWACVAGACTFQSCQTGYYDNGGPGDAAAGDHKCGYACTFVSAKEMCNGADDNCDGQVDESANLVYPQVSQVCGVSPTASTPECTAASATNPGGVTVACVSGQWTCSFATPGVCNPSCAATAEICDAYDNNCNGLVNENVSNWGQPCASDTGQPPPGDGACRTTGTYACNGPTATTCSAVKDLGKAGPELCDGIDNDCDGLVDEPFTNKGSNSTYFVKPAVTKIGTSLWIFSYEASRPSATALVAGTGNGYRCTSCASGIPSAPSGVTLDKTPACSSPGVIPWFDVTPIEAEQTCGAMGGHLCTTAEWQTACITSPPGTTTCQWGYAPNGSACTTSLGGGASGYPFPIPATTAKWCNLGPTYDFNTTLSGDQDGLLVTASSALKNCFADWTALQGNTTATGKIFDITGNLREITKSCSGDGVTCSAAWSCCSAKCVNGTCGCKGAGATCMTHADCCSGSCSVGKCVGGTAGTTPGAYPMMGGAFDSLDEQGATCAFNFYTADQSFELYDLGFRCCFAADPTM